eukprot:SAG11_NODE_8353_length_1025_cov_1.917927_2_plen_188_part_00
MCMMMQHKGRATSQSELNSNHHDTLGQHQLAAQTRSKTRQKESQIEKRNIEITESEDHHASATPSSQMVVERSIGGVRVACLLDSGASISFVAEVIIDKMKPTPKILKQNLEIVLGDASVKESTGKIKCPLTLNGVQLPGEFNILTSPSAHFKCIIGTDFMFTEPRSTGSPGPSRGPSGAWAIYLYL